MEKITSVARSALQRFAQLPPWAVLAQLFLGIGWLRAGTAHGFSGTWWNGEELLLFVAERRPQALPVYGFFLDNFVLAIPTGFAAVVLFAEFGIGISLLANVKRLEALAVGCFLNLHFIAAGQVNPSIFYLIISLSLGGRLLESQLSTERVGRLARVASILAAVAVVLLIPAVDTMAPASVIEDPASVLIFLALLVVGALWASYARRIGATGEVGAGGGRWLTTEEVVDEVEHRTGYAFSAELHATVARKVGVRPVADDAERTTKRDFAIYVAEADRYLYSQPWIDALVGGLSTAESFEKLVDQPPRACGSVERSKIDPPTTPAAPRIDRSAEDAERAELAELIEKAIDRTTVDLAGSETELELVSLDPRSVDRETKRQGFEIVVRR